MTVDNAFAQSENKNSSSWNQDHEHDFWRRSPIKQMFYNLHIKKKISFAAHTILFPKTWNRIPRLHIDAHTHTHNTLPIVVPRLLAITKTKNLIAWQRLTIQ